MKKKLHIVSFDNPFPPKYGGVIDVFYKIKTFHQLNIDIILHIFYEDYTEEALELKKYCHTIFYYKRKNKLLSIASKLPFRVKSRTSKKLIENIKKEKAPILYEGLHSCASLIENTFNNTYVRAHNIEHNYFFGLAKSEQKLHLKIFFNLEALKLKKFENHLKKVSGIFSIAPIEQTYFSSNYKNSYYVCAFHDAEFAKHTSENNTKYILWHGDLRTADNIKSVLFLISIYAKSKINFKIASSCINKKIQKAIAGEDNIEFVNLKEETCLDSLISNAHINVLYTFQNTGIKLKLLNALYKGKFVLGNDLLIKDTALENTCNIANSKSEFLNITQKLFTLKFTAHHTEIRKKTLEPFSPTSNAKKMLNIIFRQN